MKFLSLLLFMFAFQLKAQQEMPLGKFEHLVAGSAISIGSYAATEIYFKDLPKIERRLMAKRISIATVFATALGREIYDYYKYKKVDNWNYNTQIDGVGDFVTTCLAGMTVSLVIPF